WDDPCIAVLVNLLCGRQYDSALLSQVFHSNLAYLMNILLIRYIFVKEIIVKIYLDSILLASILLRSWEWSRLNKRGINVIAAPTNGYPARTPWENLGSVHYANRHIGTSPENISARRGNLSSLTSLAEREGFEPPSRFYGCEASLRLAVLQTAAFDHSAISPLNGPGEESASQTFAPHSATINASSEWNIRDVFPIPPVVDLTVIRSRGLDFALIFQSLQCCVNDSKRVLVIAQRKTVSLEGVANHGRRYVRALVVLRIPQNFSDRLGDSNRLWLELFPKQFAQTQDSLAENLESAKDVCRPLLNLRLLVKQCFHFSFSGLKGIFVMSVSHCASPPFRMEFT